jgi:hypothetical protein
MHSSLKSEQQQLSRPLVIMRDEIMRQRIIMQQLADIQPS